MPTIHHMLRESRDPRRRSARSSSFCEGRGQARVSAVYQRGSSPMAEVYRLPERHREYIADGDRSAMRATWHSDAGFVVISLWRGDTCVATSHLTPGEAGRLATFITGGLADLAMEWHAHNPNLKRSAPPISMASRLSKSFRVWRGSMAWSLESIARRLR